jgi:hypothetical protein
MTVEEYWGLVQTWMPKGHQIWKMVFFIIPLENILPSQITVAPMRKKC